MSAPRHPQADVVLRDGSTVHVRPVQATDAPAVHAFFEHLPPKSITLRFFCGFPDSLDRAVSWATDVDDQHRCGLIATSSADGRVVAHAGWEREPDRPNAPRSPSPSPTPCSTTGSVPSCSASSSRRPTGPALPC